VSHITKKTINTHDNKVDDEQLFSDLFSVDALTEVFENKFSKTTSKGIDRLSGHQFKNQSSKLIPIISEKCLKGTYKTTPFLEILKLKGRNKSPRIISIPTIRDRIVFHQLNKFLSEKFKNQTQRKLASMHIQEIAHDFQKIHNPIKTWVCSADIVEFYDSINHEKLITTLTRTISHTPALTLIKSAISTPTVPRNTKKQNYNNYKTKKGIAQGIAISNILSSIYMEKIDELMNNQNIHYHRYVDDVLIYGEERHVKRTFELLKENLNDLDLIVHEQNKGKTILHDAQRSFDYLGYSFLLPQITVKKSTVERFVQSIASKFSEYVHSKQHRLNKYKYLNEDRIKQIFIDELNEKITGAISENKRYGWIAYFNKINDQSLLYSIDALIRNMFTRLNDFDNKEPKDLKKISRAYFEIRFNPRGGYIHDYDKIDTPSKMVQFLKARGRLSDDEKLTEEEIHKRYERYRRGVLANMNKDEGSVYS
jgi:prophage PSPPH06, putative reverse transcriptase/maturase